MLLLIVSLSFTEAFAVEETKSNTAAIDEELLGQLFRNSYEVFKDLRNEAGVYRDSILLEPGDNYHPSSVASTGIGLMSLTIADKKKWDEEALAKVKQTVATMTDQRTGFHADRTTNGFYRHFINMETGAQEWGSEYSTVDTAIFLVGALFAENYFNDPALSEAVAKLYHSIDFDAAIADVETGGIYLTMNEDGTGGANSITLPYNEYIIVAWLAYNQNRDKPESKAVKLWQKYYATPDNLLTKSFHDISLLTDHPGHYLSSFTLLFPYYMVNMFSKSAEYQGYLENAYKADKRWSELTEKTKAYEWGNGAGASPEGYGYHADAINDNQSLTISPHIISGFLPINPSGSQDLLALYRNKKGLYHLQSDPSKEILWRYSVEDLIWRANSIQGIDYSTFLFGLATLDEEIGLPFFQRNNHFFKTVTFDLNGGASEALSPQYLAVNETLKEPTVKPTRLGYEFAGWGTKADGSGNLWNFAGRLDNDLTLYAQWQAETHAVVFDLNGGTSTLPATQHLAAGALIQKPSPAPVRSGYKFSGWQTQVDGGVLWDFGTDVMPADELKLVAQWQLITCQVQFDLNGGTSQLPVQELAVGDKVQEPKPEPTRSGYKFLGWYDGDGQIWDFEKMTIQRDTTLIAKWEKESANPTKSEGGNTQKKASTNTILPKTGEISNGLSLVGALLISCPLMLFYKKMKAI